VWGDGEVGKWGSGEMGKWGNGGIMNWEMGEWGRAVSFSHQNIKSKSDHYQVK
jgi:hypothetical protein